MCWRANTSCVSGTANSSAREARSCMCPETRSTPSRSFPPCPARNSIFSPAAMLGSFEELAAAEASGTATPEVLDAIAARNNVEMLGPVPDAYL
jgi:hypothetical protein